MPEEVSLFRLYLMRFLYLLNFVLLGMDVWPGLIHHGKPWDPMHGIAVSFWAALAPAQFPDLQRSLHRL